MPCVPGGYVRVHAELEAVHEETMHSTADCVIDLDIEGSLLDNAEAPIVNNTDGVQIMLSTQQEAEQVAEVYLKQLRCDIKQTDGPEVISERIEKLEVGQWSKDIQYDDVAWPGLSGSDVYVDRPSDAKRKPCSVMSQTTKQWLSGVQSELETARVQQLQAIARREWAECAELEDTMIDLKLTVQSKLDAASAEYAVTSDAGDRQKLEDCMVQLAYLVQVQVEDDGKFSWWQAKRVQEIKLELERELDKAKLEDNDERIEKIMDIITLQAEWEDDLRSKNTEKAFHTLTRLKLARRHKPLVNAPEQAEIIRDSDKEAYWIPGIFPTIFQNETGDPYNFFLKEPDLQLWGPHVMMSKGWCAQAHPTFLYWWLNMIQRRNANAAKQWFIGENKDAVAWTVQDRFLFSIKQKRVLSSSEAVCVYGRVWD